MKKINESTFFVLENTPILPEDESHGTSPGPEHYVQLAKPGNGSIETSKASAILHLMDGASISHEEPDMGDEYGADFIEESPPKSRGHLLNPNMNKFGGRVNGKYKIPLKSSPHPGPIPSPSLPEDDDIGNDGNQFLREYLLSGLQVQKLNDPETMNEILMQVGSMANFFVQPGKGGSRLYINLHGATTQNNVNMNEIAQIWDNVVCLVQQHIGKLQLIM